MYDPRKHHRRSIRLKGYDYAQPGAYFVTICVREQRCLLGQVKGGKVVLSDVGATAHGFWSHVPIHFPNVSIDMFVVMPNHVHVIIVIHDAFGGDAGAARAGRGAITTPLPAGQRTIDRPTLGQIVAYYKYQTTKRINQTRGTAGAPFWQRGYHEHIVRNERDMDRIRQYIIDNPSKWQLDRNNR